MSVMLEVREVTKRFGGVVANDRISLTVQQGEIAGLIGPNGSGKTTLFGCITGTLPVDGGEVYFEGRPISQLRAAPIARLGLLRTWQQTRIYGEMSCAENMAISAREAHGGLVSLLKPVPAATRVRAPSANSTDATKCTANKACANSAVPPTACSCNASSCVWNSVVRGSTPPSE